MSTTLCELRCKEIVNIKDGACLGCVNDLDINTDCATICALVIRGRPRFFGLFGHEESVRIPWNCIKIIGQDTILVECDFCCQKKVKKGNLFDILSNI